MGERMNEQTLYMWLGFLTVGLITLAWIVLH